MGFLVACFALAWVPTWSGSDCQGEREVISSLSATVESQWRTIRALEEQLASVTAAQAECCACAPPRDLQASQPTTFESDLWHVEEGSCVVDSEGCITSPNHPEQYPSYDFCYIEVNRSAWTGRLIVTGDHEQYGYSWYAHDSLWVDGVSGACTSLRHTFEDSPMDFCQAQVAQERVPEHSITWSVGYYYKFYPGWKICQGPPLNDSHYPWHNQPWTCDLTGAPIPFPRSLSLQGGRHAGPVSFTQDFCTTVWSDPDDLDGDGDFNTGWPYYYDDYYFDGGGGFFRCGPCSCIAGEEQRWQTFRLPGEASDTSYLSCTPCTAGRYQEAGNVVGVESPCSPCAAGSTSAAGATACSSCAFGQHTSEEGASRCLPCPAGTSFRTTSVCDPCTAGYFGTTEAATACTSCPLGSTTLSPGLSACSSCLPGRYGVEASCDSCRIGHFTTAEGETACASCPSGYIAQSEGQSACAPCASGWYGTAFACEECPPGEYAENLGQSRCARCSVGTIAVLTRSSACDACPAGQYGSNASATACDKCDVGTFTDSAGASACTRCGHHDDAGSTLWTTVGQRERGGQLQWVDADGSSSVASCTCVEGARMSERGACVPCGEGLICPLFGSVQLQPGYFAAAEDLGSVWRCHGVDPGRCPGGAPGLCARLRDNSSIACGDCEPNTRWTTDGPCETCQPSDVSVLLVAFLVTAVALFCVYCVVVNENRARNNDHVVLLATLGSQLVTVLQMMGVCKLLSVTWPKPFSTILSFTSLLNLKLEILNVGCVVGMSVVTRYAGTAFGFVALLAVMCLFHMVHMGVFHSREMLAGKWKTYRPALVGGLGSIFMLCYIAVVAAICAPLRCESHPNGQSTLVDYPQVVCWSSTDHQHMLVLGAAASCIPIGFLSMACVVLRMLPKFLAKGDTAFLHAFSFLFFRFHPGAFWFALVLLARNTGMALAPALHEETLQLFVSVLILLPCTVISSVALPWRAHLANLLDVGTNGSFVLVVFLGALFKDVDDKTLIGDLLLVILGLLGIMFLIASCICVNMFCMKRRRRKYEFFLCHHKEGSGAFCRLLKMFLQDSARHGSQIFLDSDNLQDLSGLFCIVANKVRTLVVLCSKEIVQRPWCVGEMCTARENQIDTILLCFPNFVWPSDTFIERYAEHVEGIHSLASYGISVGMVRETLHWLRARPRVLLSRRTTRSSMKSVADKLIKRRGGKLETVSVGGMWTVDVSDYLGVVVNPGSDPRAAAVLEHRLQDDAPHAQVPKGSLAVSIVDHANDEAVCAAFIIQRLLRVHFPLATKAPHVLGRCDVIPSGVTMALVICTNGCFQQAQVARHLLQAYEMGVCVLPVIVEAAFRFPTEALYHDLRAKTFDAGSDTGNRIVSFVTQLFEQIAVRMHPQDAMDVLELRASSLRERFEQESFKRLTWNDDDLLADLHLHGGLGQQTGDNETSLVNLDLTSSAA